MNTHITFNVTHERAYDKGAYDLEALFYVQHVAGLTCTWHGNWSEGCSRVQVQRMVACYLLTSGERLRYHR